jgi:hypothetical protein
MDPSNVREQQTTMTNCSRVRCETETKIIDESAATNGANKTDANSSACVVVAAVAADMHDTDASDATDTTFETTDSTTDLQMGDHAYRWCSYAGIPRVYLQHGIVLENDQVAEFCSNTKRNSTTTQTTDDSCATNHSFVVVTSIFDNNWRKVEYNCQSWTKQHFARSGTCTSANNTSEIGLVRARVQFLMDQQHSNLTCATNNYKINSECVAVWCKTGTYATLQASMYGLLAAGQVKSAVTLAGAASTTTVSVPAAGLWGWMGYSSQVSLTALHPALLPAIAAYGVLTMAAPLALLYRVTKEYKARTEFLNESFWVYAAEHAEEFADNLTRWSSEHA